MIVLLIKVMDMTVVVVMFVDGHDHHQGHKYSLIILQNSEQLCWVSFDTKKFSRKHREDLLCCLSLQIKRKSVLSGFSFSLIVDIHVTGKGPSATVNHSGLE